MNPAIPERRVARQIGDPQRLTGNDPARVMDAPHSVDRGGRLVPRHAGAQEQMHHRVAAIDDKLLLDEDTARGQDAGARQQREPGRGFGLTLPLLNPVGRVAIPGRADDIRGPFPDRRKRLQNIDRRHDQRDEATRSRSPEDRWP